jgi:hypothetical protein
MTAASIRCSRWPERRCGCELSMAPTRWCWPALSASSQIGNSAALRPLVKREVMPGDLTGKELEHFIRNAAETYWHETCTAKMGRDDMSVVAGAVTDRACMPHVPQAERRDFYVLNTRVPACEAATMITMCGPAKG